MLHSVRVLLLSFCLLPVLGLLTHAADKGLVVDATPRDAGMDAKKLAAIPGRMQEFVDAKQISGAVTLVARRGRIVAFDAVGLADIEAQRPMQKDSLFAVASMTKPIAATALMMLQDEGKLSLDDPASKYIPAFKETALKVGGRPAREITIRDLLTHTSGLGGDQRTEGTLEETVDKIARRTLDFEPGTKWQYSPSISVCGRIVEVVSGKPFDEFLSQRIFEALAMKDTTFRPSTQQQQTRLARIYKASANNGGLEPGKNFLYDGSANVTPNPSGGLFSTALDMARFYQMILNGGELDGKRIVSASAVSQMTNRQTGDLATGFTPGNCWGLGWCVVREPQGVSKMLSPGTFGHGGAFGTQGWVDPKQELIVVLLIQREGLPNADASEMRQALQQLAVDAIAD